jgi:outer membrane receptor protein involved in Fe transport
LHVAYTEFANQLQAGNFVTLDNPLLEPVKTTSFEVGFRQQIGDNAALDITAYYKELRDLVQSRLLSVNQSAYATFVNGDYGTVKGLSATFNLRRTQHIAAVAAYTLQFAGGTGSASNDAFAINWLGNPPRYPTFVAPLGFDQRHTGSVTLDFRTTAGEGPTFLNGHPLGRVGVNLLFSFGSGTPYTPGQIRSEIFASGPAAQNRPQAEINSAYTPFISQLDMKIDKSFAVAGVDLNAYLWVINLFNQNNVINVYQQTGEPDTDGYLVTASGQADIATHGEDFVSYYNARLNNPANYDIPRQIRFGLRFDLQR